MKRYIYLIFIVANSYWFILDLHNRSTECFRDLLATNIVPSLTLIFSPLSQVILCITVTKETLNVNKKQGSWSNDLESMLYTQF